MSFSINSPVMNGKFSSAMRRWQSHPCSTSSGGARLSGTQAPAGHSSALAILTGSPPCSAHRRKRTLEVQGRGLSESIIISAALSPIALFLITTGPLHRPLTSELLIIIVWAVAEFLRGESALRLPQVQPRGNDLRRHAHQRSGYCGARPLRALLYVPRGFSGTVPAGPPARDRRNSRRRAVSDAGVLLRRPPFPKIKYKLKRRNIPFSNGVHAGAGSHF